LRPTPSPLDRAAVSAQPDHAPAEPAPPVWEAQTGMAQHAHHVRSGMVVAFGALPQPAADQPGRSGRIHLQLVGCTRTAPIPVKLAQRGWSIGACAQAAPLGTRHSNVDKMVGGGAGLTLVCMLLTGCGSSTESPPDPVAYKPPPPDVRVAAVLLSAGDLATTGWQVSDSRRLALPRCAPSGIAAGSVSMYMPNDALPSRSSSAPPSSAQNLVTASERAVVFPTKSSAVAYFTAAVANQCEDPNGKTAHQILELPKLADASLAYHYDSPDVPGDGIYVAVIRRGSIVVQVITSEQRDLLALATTAVLAAGSP
jgi:hypothetical protein